MELTSGKPHRQRTSYYVETIKPIFYNEKLIAVLIFEKKADIDIENREEEKVEDAIEDIFGPTVAAIFEQLNEAVIIIGNNDEVIACNSAARNLYTKKLRYADDLMKMTLKNIQLDSDEYFFPGNDMNESGTKRKEVRVTSHDLRYTTIPLYSGPIKIAILIEDITDLKSQERKADTQAIAMREQRHRLKNSLMMLSGMLDCQEKYAAELDASSVLRDTSGRLNALAATLDEIVHVSDKNAFLKYILEKVRANVLQNSISTLQPVSIKIIAGDIEVPSAYASPIALVINELLQNAIKHAFPSGRKGIITITAEQGILSTKITVSDDGIGFDTEAERKNGTGLDIVKTIVKEKLGGEFSIISSENGTKAIFDFMK